MGKPGTVLLGPTLGALGQEGFRVVSPAETITVQCRELRSTLSGACELTCPVLTLCAMSPCYLQLPVGKPRPKAPYATFPASVLARI